MLVDENRCLVSQKQHPRMALIETALEGSELAIRIPGEKELRLSSSEEGSTDEGIVWKDTRFVTDQGREAAEVLSRFLGVKCRVVFMPDASRRQVNQNYAPSPDDVVGFVDGYPFLLISEASLEDLNQRLAVPIPMNRFRPNLVISGCLPYEEDTWKWIRIGEIRFKVAKPCARCIVTTVDQSTGEKGVEPLHTLATYRKQENGIMFGQNLIHTTQGILSIGQTVEVLEKY